MPTQSGEQPFTNQGEKRMREQTTLKTTRKAKSLMSLQKSWNLHRSLTSSLDPQRSSWQHLHRTDKRERVEAQHKVNKDKNLEVNLFLQPKCTIFSAQQICAVGILKPKKDAWLQQSSNNSQ